MSKAESKSAAPSETKKRMSNLTAEERKARASLAAKAMWEKKKAARKVAEQEQKSSDVPATEPISLPPPALEPQTTGKRVSAPPVPKEFSRALAAAEKDYAKSLEQLMYHEEMAAMLRARIPFLTQAIRALGGYAPGSAEAPGAVAVRMTGPEINYPPPEQPLPSVPMARGGSMGVINDARTEDEDQFLRDPGGIGAGGGWG